MDSVGEFLRIGHRLVFDLGDFERNGDFAPNRPLEGAAISESGRSHLEPRNAVLQGSLHVLHSSPAKRASFCP
jgi:hypothetical protein